MVVNNPKEDVKRNKKIIFQRVIQKEDPLKEVRAMKHLYSVLLPQEKEERKAIIE